MAARTKAYWNNLLITEYEITQSDWIDIVDSFILYRPETEPVIDTGVLTLNMSNASQAIFEPRLSTGT